eukprot:3138813-Amphidinium_carterae.1
MDKTEITNGNPNKSKSELLQARYRQCACAHSRALGTSEPSCPSGGHSHATWPALLGTADAPYVRL